MPCTLHPNIDTRIAKAFLSVQSKHACMLCAAHVAAKTGDYEKCRKMARIVIETVVKSRSRPHMKIGGGKRGAKSDPVDPVKWQKLDNDELSAFENLPPEIKLHIVKYIEDPEDIKNLCAASPEIEQFCNDFMWTIKKMLFDNAVRKTFPMTEKDGSLMLRVQEQTAMNAIYRIEKQYNIIKLAPFFRVMRFLRVGYFPSDSSPTTDQEKFSMTVQNAFRKIAVQYARNDDDIAKIERVLFATLEYDPADSIVNIYKGSEINLMDAQIPIYSQKQGILPSAKINMITAALYSGYIPQAKILEKLFDELNNTLFLGYKHPYPHYVAACIDAFMTNPKAYDDALDGYFAYDPKRMSYKDLALLYMRSGGMAVVNIYINISDVVQRADYIKHLGEIDGAITEITLKYLIPNREPKLANDVIKILNEKRKKIIKLDPDIVDEQYGTII